MEMKNDHIKVQLPELNWMRAIAALLVVIFHYTARYEEILGHRSDLLFSIPWGGYSVAVFFMLSGFLMTYTLNEKVTAAVFIKKRILRLYPAYWMCMGITIAVMLLWFPLHAQLPDSSLRISDVAINLTMMQGILLRPSVDGAYWTLGYELRFYGFIWLILLLRQQKKLNRWMLCWVLVSLGIVMTQKYVFSGKWIILMQHLCMPQWSAVFVTGVVLAQWYRGGDKELCIVGIFTMLTAMLTIKKPYLVAYFVSLLLIGGIVLLRHSSIADGYMRMINKMRSMDILGFIASISYPLYLLHQHIGFAIIWNCEEKGMSNELSIVVAVLVCCLFAWGIQQLANSVIRKVSTTDKCHS